MGLPAAFGAIAGGEHLFEQLPQRLRAGRESWLLAPPIFKRGEQRATYPNLDSGAGFYGTVAVHGLLHAAYLCMDTRTLKASWSREIPTGILRDFVAKAQKVRQHGNSSLAVAFTRRRRHESPVCSIL